MDPLSMDLAGLRDGSVIPESSIMAAGQMVGIAVEEEEEGDLAIELPPLSMEFTDSQMLQVTSIPNDSMRELVSRIISSNSQQMIAVGRPLASQDTIFTKSAPANGFTLAKESDLLTEKTRNKCNSSTENYIHDNSLNSRHQMLRLYNNKNEAPMITLVDNNEEDIESAASVPLVHHVNESFGSNSLERTSRSNTHCFLCSAKLAVSARGSANILDDSIITAARQVSLSTALSEIISQDLTPSSPMLQHSSLLCKKCLKQLEDHDTLLAQIENIRQDMLDKLRRGSSVADRPEVSTNSKPEANIKREDSELVDGDTEFKVYMALPEARRGSRGKGRGRGRGRGYRRAGGRGAHIKVEVKQEGEEEGKGGDDWNNASDTVQMTINSTSLHPMVEVTEMNGSVDHHFLDIGARDGELEARGLSSDEVVMDCLDVPCQFELDPQEISQDLKDSSQTARVLFALPVDDPDDGGAPWDRYKCLYCGATTKLFSAVIEHIRQQHEDKLYECEVCSSSSTPLKFSTRMDLLDHLDEHLQQDARQLKCDACSKRFVLPKMLRQHQKHHLAKTVMCSHCTRRFKTETAIQEHIYTHTGCRPFKCDHCSKKFNSRYALKLHVKTHLVRERNFKCEICSKEFLSYHHLVEHSHVHQDTKNFICETCGKGFSTTRSLDLHSLIHTGIKNYACKICGKHFARKGEVEDHERIHTGEKPFQCEICGATFSQRSNLQSHKKATHYKEKKHKCDKCNKAFKRRRLLDYHRMSVHTGERPYKCTRCNAAFVYPEHYKKHIRIHTGEKPFKCDVCGKAFNSRDNRNVHKFIHSERKPYECTICNVGFMRKPMLMNHISQHAHVTQPEMCVRVNPPSVADEAPPSGMEDDPISAGAGEMYPLKMGQGSDIENSVQIVGGDGPLHIIEDLPRYVLQNNERGPFLASIQGQLVEVRPDGGVHVRGEGLYEFSEEAMEASGDGPFQLQLASSGEDGDELELQTVEAGPGEGDENELLARSFQFETQVVDGNSQRMPQLRSDKRGQDSTVPEDVKDDRNLSNKAIWNDVPSFMGPEM